MRMSAIYTVISEADLSKKTQKGAQKEGRATKKRDKLKAEKKNSIPPKIPTASPPVPSSVQTPGVPGLNINLEIHISSDATPDQIDKIFESMAKHIYRK